MHELKNAVETKTKTKTKKLLICPKFVMLYITHLVCQIERARRQMLR